MKHPTLKDYRTALQVLEYIGCPSTVKIVISDHIREMEKKTRDRRLARMTEEDIITYEERPKNRVRITTFDGRLIQRKTNEETFLAALCEANLDRLVSLDIIVNRKPLVVHAPSRVLMKGYTRVAEGYFVRHIRNQRDRLALLNYIDSYLQLNWDIEKV